MREAISSAPVGDDQFGEDPTINLLQDRIAALLGKEAALWLPTGTMANQVALRVLTRPGDDVIVSRESHAVWHETGGSAANSGVHLTAVGDRGVFSLDEFLAAVKPRDHIVMPPTTLVEIENTHNRAGGVVFPQREAERICSEAKNRGIATYLDGARLWNAAVASNLPVDRLAEPFDLVSVALSKGLGAPGGSLLAGTKETIKRCVRHRRMLGGAMRQVGIFAAAGLFAIENNFGRLTEDHTNARLIAERISNDGRFIIDQSSVQSNILVFNLATDAPDAPTVVARARERGVLLLAFGPRTLRLVTHFDVTRTMCLHAAEILLEVVNG
jgi:threonine aldolase